MVQRFYNSTVGRCPKTFIDDPDHVSKDSISKWNFDIETCSEY